MELELENAISVLQTTPSILRAWLAPLPAEWVHANDGGGTWSPFDVVGHLIHGEKTDWIPRAEIILSQSGSREFEPFDRFAMFKDSADKSIQDLLDTFADLRQRSIERLRALNPGPAEFSKTGIHPTLGTVTLSQLLTTWVAHDLNHLGQIAEVMARQYEVEVGPWKESLEILGP